MDGQSEAKGESGARPSGAAEPLDAGLVDHPGAGVLLRRVFVVMAAGAALVGGLGIGLRRASTAIIALVVLAVSLSMLRVVRRGAHELAAVAAVATLLAAAVAALLSGHGLHDVGASMFAAVLVLAAMLLRSRAFTAVTALSLGAAAGVGVAEMTGLLETPFAPIAGWDDVVVFSVVLGVVAVSTRAIVRSAAGSLHRERQSQRSYREIFDAVEEAILVHDAGTGEVLDANASAARLFGCRRDELVGSRHGRFSSGTPAFGDDVARERLARALTEGPQVFEWRSRRADGSEFWTEVTLRAAEIEGERRLLAVVRDIEERKAMEERARQDDKLRSLGLLAGGVAHDFNNQLVGIVSYGEMLRAELAGDPRFGEHLDAILGSARRASELTRQLLAFARKSKQRSDVVDVHAVVGDLVRLLSRSIDKRITVETRLAAESAAVLGDASLLQNALLNLALNARDAMPDGGRITIASRLVDWPAADGRIDRMLEVAITDTGAGMSPVTLARVFEPFFTTKARGTGMGLAATYGTVKAHGGTIEVVSEPGRGSTFTVRLPLHEAPRPVAAEPSDGRLSVRPGVRVLVVDDEPLVRTAMARVLERAGCSVVPCEGGAEALREFEARGGQVDVVVLDGMMPGMSGREVLRALRAKAPELPFVLVTGYAEPASEWEVATRTPHAAKLAKPFEPAELVRAVDRLTRGAAAPVV
jgi:PAS domain S-box-containing protein